MYLRWMKFVLSLPASFAKASGGEVGRSRSFFICWIVSHIARSISRLWRSVAALLESSPISSFRPMSVSLSSSGLRTGRTLLAAALGLLWGLDYS